MIDVLGAESCLVQAVADRAVREGRVVLDAGEPLLLDRGDELPVDDECSRSVAVVRIDAEDVHASSGLG